MSDRDAAVAKISEPFKRWGFVAQTKGNNLPYCSKRAEAIYKPSANRQLAVKRLADLTEEKKINYLGEIKALMERQALEMISIANSR